MVLIADAVKGSILEKLFTWQYFEPVLFGSIGVLLVLLFIVLFLGKKDQKRKLEETKQLELNSLKEDNSIDAFAKEDTSEKVEVVEEPIEPELPPVVIEDAPVMNMDTTEIEEEPIKEEITQDVSESNDTMPDFEVFNKKEDEEEVTFEPVVEDIPIVAEPVPVKEEPAEVDDVVKSIVVDDEAIKNELVIEQDKATEEKIESFKENFADLASSISKELDEINRLQEESASKEVELPKPSEEVSIPKEVDVTPISKFAPTEVFSSVYSPSSVKEEEKPVFKDEVDLPKQADLDNPFADDMPAIKEEHHDIPSDDTPVNTPDFSAFQNESFDIK